jgi:hypothetical protein
MCRRFCALRCVRRLGAALTASIEKPPGGIRLDRLHPGDEEIDERVEFDRRART